jgi:hypothetical protein
MRATDMHHDSADRARRERPPELEGAGEVGRGLLTPNLIAIGGLRVHARTMPICGMNESVALSDHTRAGNRPDRIGADASRRSQPASW